MIIRRSMTIKRDPGVQKLNRLAFDVAIKEAGPSAEIKIITVDSPLYQTHTITGGQRAIVCVTIIYKVYEFERRDVLFVTFRFALESL